MSSMLHLSETHISTKYPVARRVVQDLIDCNQLLYYTQKTGDIGLFYRYGAFDFNNLSILCVSDASHAADYDVSESGQRLGHRSQSGRTILLADRNFMDTGKGVVHPIEYHSNIIRRVCRSTLQAETLSIVQRYEEGEHLRSITHGLRHPQDHSGWMVEAMDQVPMYLITDCRSLESHLLQAGLGTTGDKRLAIDLSGLRQVIWRRPNEQHGDPLYDEDIPANTTTKAIWVDTKSMLSDCLTKKMKGGQMEAMQATGSLEFLMDKTVSKKADKRAATSNVQQGPSEAPVN